MTHYVIVESVCRNSIVVNSMTKLASSRLLSQIISKTFLMPDRGFYREALDILWKNGFCTPTTGNMLY